MTPTPSTKKLTFRSSRASYCEAISLFAAGDWFAKTWVEVSSCLSRDTRAVETLASKLQAPASIEAGAWVPWWTFPSDPLETEVWLSSIAPLTLQHAAQFILNVKGLW